MIQEDIDSAIKKREELGAPKGTLSDFAKKFQGRANPDGTITQGDEDEPEERDQKPPQSLQKPRGDFGKKPSYVKTIEAEKAALEAEKKALTAEKDQLTQKINDLSTQLATAKTQKDIDAILAERDAKIQEREQTLNRLSEENKTLKSKVTLYDLTEDPEFVRDYIEPINRASEHLMELISGDETANDKITQVAALNNGILSTQDPEKRRRLQDQRDTLIGEIAEGLVAFRRDDFLSNMRDLITLSKKRADAIADHAKTFEKIQNARKDAQLEASRKIGEQWSGAFKEVSEEIEGQIKIPEKVQTYITTNGISLDTSRDEDIAQSSIRDGAKNYQPRDVAKILKQGAVYGRLKAISEAQQKIIEEQDQTIAELRGASTKGSGGGGGNPKEKDEKEKSEAFFGRFRPPNQ